jgi:hypothetical protein
MTDVAKLRDLLSRVEAASGPDVRLDRAINKMFPDGELGSPYYTSSIDAAVALAERALPGFSILMAVNPGKAMANIHSAPLGVNGKWFPAGRNKTLPLAICSATIRAKIAELEQPE